ncbi:hypothetical protein POPTR_014G098800v4 [Populus trichocarpa]|uniref:S-adenosyl-L-methionine-dependent methyltransferase n=1 Tax=Populus trichocarpa TaxID=3694 RepID=U5FV31_POPTR|nr:hypothetical protein BDE02_14G081200 [Populus trichocarpa]PNT03972.1 hypothetical protein POPTR_014G098800v4 [Populus trichocarpa]
MEWSATSATEAYLDTLKLCGNHKRRYDSWMTKEPGSNEFISALAAGMKAKLIVEVAYGVSPSTVALAAAARQTGGRLVCILPEPVPAESKKVIKDSGLKDIVDFKTGDPSKLLPNYEKIDFSLVDCKNDEYTGLLKLIDVNPRRSVVVANNLVGEKKGLGGHVRCLNDEVVVRSMKHPIGKGMEVTMIGKSNDIEKRDWGSRESSSPPKTRENAMKKTISSNWIVKVDEKSGEEHIYRVPNFI